MWIIDQTGLLSVNTDSVSYINVEKKTNSIKATLDSPGRDTVKVHLGTYQSLEDCKKVFETITIATPANMTIRMPLGGDDIDKFVNDIFKQTEKILRILL